MQREEVEETVACAVHPSELVDEIIVEGHVLRTGPVVLFQSFASGPIEDVATLA